MASRITPAWLGPFCRRNWESAPIVASVERSKVQCRNQTDARRRGREVQSSNEIRSRRTTAGNASGMHFFECEDCGTIARVPVPHSPPKK